MPIRRQCAHWRSERPSSSRPVWLAILATSRIFYRFCVVGCRHSGDAVAIVSKGSTAAILKSAWFRCLAAVSNFKMNTFRSGSIAIAVALDRGQTARASGAPSALLTLCDLITLHLALYSKGDSDHSPAIGTFPADTSKGRPAALHGGVRRRTQAKNSGSCQSDHRGSVLAFDFWGHSSITKRPFPVTNNSE